jgi:hypothetical protein
LTFCKQNDIILKKEGVHIMDANTIIQLVGSLGFPIVMCGALFWRMVKSDEQHKAEMDKLSEALNNNTIALTKLSDKLEKGD